MPGLEGLGRDLPPGKEAVQGGLPAIPVGISNRHIHLSRKHVEELFGNGYQLTSMKDLGQPGQYAAKETVTLIGSKGLIEGVRILGPERPETQIEISMTDAYKIGVRPPIRDSGDLEGTPGVVVVGPQGAVTLTKGVILALRHIHLSDQEGEALGLKDKEVVRVQVPGQRGIIFENVLARVSPSYRMEFHVDTDEANCCVLQNNQNVYLIKDVQDFNFHH